MSRAFAAGMSFHLHPTSELSKDRWAEIDSAIATVIELLAAAQCPAYSQRATPVTPTAPHIYAIEIGFQASTPEEVVELQEAARAALADRVTDHWRTS